MKNNNLASLSKLVSLSLVIAIGGCSIPDRSRNLNDASISANTTAMQVCSSCHGVRGVSTSPNFPNLAAQSQPYLVKQLTEFRSHQRSDPEGFEYMWGISHHLTDAQNEGLATYFSKQSPPPGRASSSARVSAGREIFEQGIAAGGVPACATCHGAQAEGTDEFPRLAGQHPHYLVRQLLVFQGTDQRPNGVAMKAITHSLTPDNMKNVAAYLETIPPVSK